MFLNEIVWANQQTFGCEYLKCLIADTAVLAESTVVYLEPSSSVQIDYQIEMDRSWRTKHVNIYSKSGQSLRLTSIKSGKWTDQNGTVMTELEGAIDIDISATPFTNSLPVNRFDWKPNQQRELDMVYIAVPSLEVSKMKQTYTFIGSRGEIRVFNFQSPGFESLISTDEKGFVVDYPGLFKRKY
ncbi:hypothetical protein SAMN04487975_112108 [Planococcus glaciei]|uniref:putative glycolipid-binding domain-containing protein n=1 Tax=Planococcus glaciei TaxID=459472 RepID=UPI00088E3546|nr:putative glycolipid-binding domain-containing protein [Planococcus glaciei]SDI15714.1 hypothetical protein SAMN04487975_112108 [Planococcus glaciei]